ncbi:MAG: ECF transporter S component [Candidatus Ranarchaeia archaeon]
MHSWHGFSTIDLVLLAQFGALIAISKFIFRLPVQIPGHSGFFWMSILIVNQGVVRKLGSGFIVGAVSGMLAFIFGIGSIGILVILKYVFPGVVVDLLWWLVQQDFRNPVCGTIAGALANLTKLLANTFVNCILGVPANFLLIGLQFAFVSHLIFGSLGGFVASLALVGLYRSGGISILDQVNELKMASPITKSHRFSVHGETTVEQKRQDKKKAK